MQDLIDRIDRLEWALIKLITKHHVCEDSWYSCVVTDDNGNRYEGCTQDCTCGADGHNEFIGNILKEGTEIREKYLKEENK